MKNSIVAASVRQAHRVEIVTETALKAVEERFAADGQKGQAARAGRQVIIKDHLTRRRLATGRFGARVLLDAAGVLPLYYDEVMPLVTSHLLRLEAESRMAEIGLTTFFAQAWNWSSEPMDILGAFSYVLDPQAAEKVWVSCSTEESITEGFKAVGHQEWMAIGFWDALRWFLENHEGVAVINDAEHFSVKTLSDLFRIRAQLGWWSSFAGKASQLYIAADDRLSMMEQEYALSGGSNTHYVGEAQEQWEAAKIRLEKANEAAELLASGDVQTFIEDLCMVFELAEKDVPNDAEYSEEKEFIKQLASVEAAAASTMDAVRLMIAKAIEKGSLSA